VLTRGRAAEPRAPAALQKYYGRTIWRNSSAFEGQGKPYQLLVCGYHNTGTSILTRLLMLLGVWLGYPADILLCEWPACLPPAGGCISSTGRTAWSTLYIPGSAAAARAWPLQLPGSRGRRGGNTRHLPACPALLMHRSLP
jgi:hypothetical protein